MNEFKSIRLSGLTPKMTFHLQG